MKRTTPAANQLIMQAARLNPKVKAQAVGEPDGLGYFRSIEFDAATSKQIVPILEVIEDPRIASIEYEGKGKAVVTFVPDTRADFKDEYPLQAVNLILTEQKASEKAEEQAQ